MRSFLKAAELLIDLHDARLTDEKKTRILSTIRTFSKEEEQELFRLSEQNSALIYTIKQLDSIGYSSELFLKKKKKIEAPLAREQRRYQKVNEILKHFQTEKIDIIGLKGTALGSFLYGASFYKRMNDFDFLIHLEDLERVKALLRALKYAPVGDLLDREKDVYTTHHLSPWVHEDLSCVLGIHW